MCESGYCGKAYCVHCVDDFFKAGTWESFTGEEKWICFLCTRQEQVGVLSIRPDHILRIDKMFDEGNQIPLVNAPSISGSKIRVLSLFDGISTGFFALSKLGIEMDAYYASETDKGCINVSAHSSSGKVINVGDITSITEEDVKRMSPIHLVIGGPPCIEADLDNRKAKESVDFDGMFHPFLEFYRILCLVSKCNENGFYWLYENVTPEGLSPKDLINRYLQCEPFMQDTIYVSPQHKERLFWGNLPLQLHTIAVRRNNMQGDLLSCQSATSSQKVISERISCDSPISDEQNNNSSEFIAELEKILGFTVSNFNIWNMSATQRKRALQAARSIPVIMYLFTPFQQICVA
ncbi:hypothetical protein PPYR_05848 [Photinus pyralis]|uniref:Uncharacterized protein n=1 Tax=Photinus pyralis TaxID=7054 RepID=A0A5N4AVY4_PHOPY|nr:DNA (cytosine-5)-methyltransferase 3A-like [Photinus pyralis]XP_031336682.1 DNA (cytosine-5)-methyltransferase 3A-like [Photinus pyralis]KAB0791185.1 hypothetical protein PPYR_02985 [Photinus pyralis]KAB0801494.1 hypothetical protein PPYR_05848 [Photinus pyralis]